MKKVLFALFVLLVLCSCSSQFDKEVWSDEPEKRNAMVNSLVNKYELIGMMEKEIVTLLGEPAQKLEEPTMQYVYYLGRAGLGVDDSLFRLHFADDGKLKSHEISHD